MNPKVIPFLHEELRLHKNIETECARQAIELSLELGDCPENLYTIMEARGMGEKRNIHKRMSRVGPKLWARGAGIFHPEESEYESPLDTLHDILYYLSDQKIW